tara:strand:+ start:201 stop:434 length:234 start_codon:yes stop_codon:yes gene_type:complete
METYTIIEWTIYLGVIVAAVYFSYKDGEKSGSMYMLEYLRENKYKNSDGIEVPYFDDTGFNRFMAHMREQKKEKDGE